MLRGKYPDPSLWLRGLGPPHVRPVTYQQRLVSGLKIPAFFMPLTVVLVLPRMSVSRF